MSTGLVEVEKKTNSKIRQIMKAYDMISNSNKKFSCCNK